MPPETERADPASYGAGFITIGARQETPNENDTHQERALATRRRASSWDQAGCSVTPVRADGSKAPALPWKAFQATRSTAAEHDRWFGQDSKLGIGVATGAVSGNLEMLELEGRAVAEGYWDRLAVAMADAALSGVWDVIFNGYLESSPSGGIHCLVRITDGAAAKSIRLARRPATDAELVDNPEEKLKVLIETRGEGGFVITVPSGGAVHVSGRPWIPLIGTPQTIPTITAAERDAIYAVCGTFDQPPATEVSPKMSPAVSRISGAPETMNGGAPRAFAVSPRPGDDFNERANWRDILEPHGWTCVHPMGNGSAWRRPGKAEGISATTGQSSDGADRFYPFTTSTAFEAGQPYTKFAAYALLNHEGDYSAAAKELRANGYGDGLPPQPGGPAQIVSAETAIAESTGQQPPADAKPVDGARLLEDLQSFLARFVAYPSVAALIAHVLWIVHAHLMDCWESTARIAFLSPEPGSGKSRCLEVTEPLVPRPVHAVNTAPAYLFRKVSDPAGAPTILYDEIDTVFGPKAKDNEDIRGMVNAGHRRGAVAGRCVVRGKMVETEELPAYCAVAMAGLNDLPDTLMTRAVVIRMRRRRPANALNCGGCA